MACDMKTAGMRGAIVEGNPEQAARADIWTVVRVPAENAFDTSLFSGNAIPLAEGVCWVEILANNQTYTQRQYGTQYRTI